MAQDADIVLHRRRSLLVFADYGVLPPQQVAKCLLHDVPSNFRNGFSQGDILGTDFDAILRVSAFLNSAVSHQSGQTLTLQCSPRWMGDKQTCLRDGGGANEIRGVVELRAGFHAAAT